MVRKVLYRRAMANRRFFDKIQALNPVSIILRLELTGKTGL